MTQRIHSQARAGIPRRTLKARAQALQAAADAAPRSAMDRAWSTGYMAVSVLAIAAACAVAGGETANAQLRVATAAIGPLPLAQDICTAGGARHGGAALHACAHARSHGSDAPGMC